MRPVLAWFCLLLTLVYNAGAETFEFPVPSGKQLIVDASPASGATNQILTAEVTGLGANRITHVSVSLTMVPSGGNMFNGDYYVFLFHNTSSAILLNRVGRTATNGLFSLGYSDSGFDIVFDDDATNGDVHLYQQIFIPEYPSPLTGTWQPDGRDSDPLGMLDTDPRTRMLSQFIGDTADGIWALYLMDCSSDGASKITRWGLTIETEPAPPEEYTLTTSVLGGGSITVTPDLTNYVAGTNIEVLAVPLAGYAFAGWEGDLQSTNNPEQLVVSTNLALTARFIPVPIVLAEIVVEEEMLFELHVATNVVTNLVYQLLEGPEGATLDPATGLLSWTPTEIQGPSTNVLRFAVADALDPGLATTNELTLLVNEANLPPLLLPISNLVVNAEEPVSVFPSASDPDSPTNQLFFELLTLLPGVDFNTNSGALAWTPANPITNTDYTVSLAVRDDGVPSLSATQTFLIQVIAKPVPPPTLKVARTNGVPELWVAATAGYDYVVESSTNLVIWEDAFLTNAAPEIWSFATTNIASKIFYRVRVQR